MQIASADYNALKHLKTFENKEEINNTIRAFLYHFKHKLTPAAIATLKIVSRFAVKIPGVCWAKIGTIAELAGKTSRTIHRALNLLEETGIVKRIKTIRKNGGYGHPIIIIQPMPDLSLPDDVTSDVTSEMSHRQEPTTADTPSDQPAKNDSETMILKTKSFRENKNNNIYMHKCEIDKIELDSNFVSKEVPKEFVERVKIAFTQAIDIERLWHSTKVAFKKVWGPCRIDEESMELVFEAWRKAVKKYKQRKIEFNKIPGYYYGTLHGMVYDQRMSIYKKPQLPDLFYDFIGEEDDGGCYSWAE
ncbi:helix-turn-helix domain-containing protein [Corallococcus sp. AB032C]|uniref:helix-turn-helix domain-containing protein n=1 Tax=Corallococcus sp. AB032C TaxID=2316717 RepID=UPI000EDE9896|nr:helix-turn-helix domain-containing protein [Corallococcus sp. AB032C]RKH76996.1 helix-turn-helix domain-containing protein [Corallococcus sp. AB032C]